MSKGVRRGSTVEMVRQYASVSGIVQKKQIMEALQLNKNKVVHAVDQLLQQGYLERISYGTYRFLEARTPVPCPVEDLIWRALRINTRFSAGEIARQVGSDTSYVYRVFRRLREDNYIKQDGVWNLDGGGAIKMWRLTRKGKEKAESPAEVIFVPDKMVEQTVTLNKLICSGLAQRDEDARVKAIELCRQIAEQLTDDMEA